LYGDSVGGSFETGDAADTRGQRVAVMGTGTPREGAVDIEEDQRSVAQ
jgi:hypothetical protein